ncbi:MAG: GNAT family N-acetyltransferase [Gammaproteobacteria bacterium]|nr:GNAT family N-acetyltransferase [Gammaproteobacteria bacterium]
MNISIFNADWTKDKNAIMSIRQQVFIDEQKVPEKLEWDQHDTSAFHCLVTADAQLVATARLQTDAQLGRMAVLKPFRNKGIGRLLLKHMIDLHRSQLSGPLFIHAQAQAMDFYTKAGFIKQGPQFIEAGIAHYKMRLET